MFERFTDGARQVLVFAQDEAKVLEHGYVGTEHILLGAIEQSGPIADGLGSLGVTLEALIARIEERTDPDRRRASGPRPYTPRAKRVLDLAGEVATGLGHDRVEPAHLVLALFEGEDVVSSLVSSLGAEPVAVRSMLIELLNEAPEVEEPHLNGKSLSLEVEQVDEAGELDAGDEVSEPAPPVPLGALAAGADPVCPRCDANLLASMRWRQHVASGSFGDPLMVYLVYCGNCGRTLEVRIEE